MTELVPHPHSPSRVARAIAVKATCTADAKLSLHYEVHGDLSRMNIPAPGPARIGWKLWRSTCCEVFVRAEGAAAYHELNFSPSGEWAVYAFERYREGSSVMDEALNPQIAIETQPQRLDLYALVDLARLSSAYRTARLRVGLAVIIEEESGAYSYWALRHAPGKPDFHHEDAFALTLDEVRR
jgi:hypothetical protein